MLKNIKLLKSKSNNEAFTFIELIVIVTIITILGIIGYISYNSFISKSRDSSRISQVSTIFSGLESSKQKGKIPLPDEKIDIKYNGQTIIYQGEAGNKVLKTIGYKENGLDPKYGTYFVYSLNEKRRNIQLATFLENNVEGEDNFYKYIDDIEIDKNKEKIPKTYGEKIGILLDKNLVPIHKNTSGIDISTTTKEYIAIFSNTENIKGKGDYLQVLYGTAITGIVGNNCKDYIRANKGYKLKSGFYLINDNGILKKESCTMN